MRLALEVATESYGDPVEVILLYITETSLGLCLHQHETIENTKKGGMTRPQLKI